MINFIEIVNQDPLLSEFKYHFYIRKVFLPRNLNFQQYAKILYQGFCCEFLNQNSIYIVQISYIHPDTDYIDLVVGFRKDQIAIKIARQNKTFFMYEKYSKLQLSKSFKIYLDQQNKRVEQNKIFELQRKTSLESQLQNQEKNNTMLNQYQMNMIINNNPNLQTSKSNINSMQRKKSKDSYSSSSSIEKQISRSRDKNKKRNIMDRFNYQPEKQLIQRKSFQLKKNTYPINVLMVPMQIYKQSIIDNLLLKAQNPDQIISGEWKKEEDLNCIEVIISNKQMQQKIIEQGMRINGVQLLILGKITRIRDSLYHYQMKFIKIEKSSYKHYQQQNTVDHYFQLCNKISKNKILSEKGNKIVNISHLEGKQYLVTFNKKCKTYDENIKIEGWLLQPANPYTCRCDRPSLSDTWYQVQKKLQRQEK